MYCLFPLEQTVHVHCLFPLEQTVHVHCLPVKKLQQTALYFFLLLSFKENKTWNSMWILWLAEDSHEISSLIFSEKTMKKYLFMSSAAVIIGASRVNTNLSPMISWYYHNKGEFHFNPYFSIAILTCWKFYQSCLEHWKLQQLFDSVPLPYKPRTILFFSSLHKVIGIDIHKQLK